MVDALAPQFSNARYAKGKIAVRCPTDGSGMKTRAARICAAVSSRYSGRERAYIMSPGAAAKVKAVYESERDATLGEVRGKVVARDLI